MLRVSEVTIERPPQQFRYDLFVQTGEIAAIQGVSGVGKSTLLECLAGFIHPVAGDITWNDVNLLPLEPRERPVSMLFQEHNLFEHLSVRDNLHLALGKDNNNDIHQAALALGISDHLHKLPAELSGGQRQRVALIRTLMRPEPLILLDEPFSELDDDTRSVATGWAREQARLRQKTMLVVTHQAEDVTRLADRVITLV
ncbi:ATP-binding cassette domain-containing protein [Hahella ganghwensis]|uniref:ATP-binding cassette domain-containing protein n=1 Tax=Hahella ganghwensis TaxID=286420 RepID=UPI00036F6D73|nr:ATP-binding cassette domain-containing protein [Hahella ganghwensis]